MQFSEESSRAIYEMGNVELIELKQTPETTQCLSCLKQVFEGMTLSMWQVATTQWKDVGPNPRSIRSIESPVLSYCTNHVERKEMW